MNTPVRFHSLAEVAQAGAALETLAPDQLLYLRAQPGHNAEEARAIQLEVRRRVMKTGALLPIGPQSPAV